MKKKRRKRILIDCRNLSYPGSGLCSYSEGVIAELSAFKDDFHFIFLVDDKESIKRLQLPFHYSIMISGCKKSNMLLRDIDEQFLIPFRLLFYHIDVFHGLDFYVPFLKTKYKKVVTIHDCAVFRDLVSGSFRTIYRCVLQRLSAKTSDKIIAISNFTKKEIINVHKIKEDKIVVAPNGIKEIFYKPTDDRVSEDVCKRISQLGSYILYYGGYRKNKDVDILIDAFRKVKGYSLILTGSASAIHGLLERKAIKDKRIINWGFASDEELKCLLDYCAAFVFPSSYEGFGLPVAEALSRGVKVICRDIEVLREVGGGDVVYFKDCDDLAKLIQNINNNPNPGRRVFRYTDAIKQYIKIYDE